MEVGAVILFVLFTLAISLYEFNRFRESERDRIDAEASRRFDQFLERFAAADKLAIQEAVSLHRAAEKELVLVARSASCILWHSEVVEEDGELVWDLRVFSEQSGDFVHIDSITKNSRVHAWHSGRDQELLQRLNTTASKAIRDNHSGYRQEFRVMSKDGSDSWFDEDVRIEKLDERRWHLFGVSMDVTKRVLAEKEREKLIEDLQAALSQVKELRGLLPICSSCKKVRDDEGYWNQIDIYIRDHSEVEFSHGLCPECVRTLYPDFADDE